MNETEAHTVRLAVTSLIHRLIMIGVGLCGAGAVVSQNDALVISAAVGALVTLALSMRSSISEKKRLLNTQPPTPTPENVLPKSACPTGRCGVRQPGKIIEGGD